MPLYASSSKKHISREKTFTTSEFVEFKSPQFGKKTDKNRQNSTGNIYYEYDKCSNNSSCKSSDDATVVAFGKTMDDASFVAFGDTSDVMEGIPLVF